MGESPTTGPSDGSAGSDEREWFRDDLIGTDIGEWWDHTYGLWKQEHGVVTGRGVRDLWLAHIGIPREGYARVGLDVPVMWRETDHLRLERMTLW